MQNRCISDSLRQPPTFIAQLQTYTKKAQHLFTLLISLRTEEARLKSERIDAQLAFEAVERAKERGAEVSLLLLGQSESGKSTLQKQFQLIYAPHTFNEERAAWRGIIFINIISAVRDILQALKVAQEEENIALNDFNGGASNSTNNRRRPAAPSLRSDPLHLGQLRLSPLLSMEPKLVLGLDAGYHTDIDGSREIFVHQGWQTKILATLRSGARDAHSLEGMGRASLERDEPVSEASRLLDACKDYIRDLAGHPAVTNLIKSGKIVLKESSTFFLSDLDRLSSSQWTPTDHDILCARVRTVGIATYTYTISDGGKTRSWHLFDVGGTRGQRKAWLPFFEGTTATIFLAPVSAFDEFLDEAPSISRMDDSMELFSTISSSPLLRKTHIVLFLNKSDILKRKLRDGIQIADYMASFAPRRNEISVALKFFRDQFSRKFYQKNQSSDKRQLFVHITSVVDTKQMEILINYVIDGIHYANFRSALLV